MTDTQKDQLETLKRLTDAAKGWNGIENPADSTTVTITFDTHEQARKFSQSFGHLLWIAWAIELYHQIAAHQEDEA